MSLENYHTYKEIISQPETWTKTATKFLESGIASLPNPEGYEQVIFIGCGSTYYISIWGARAMQSRHPGFVRPLPSSELMLYPKAWIPEGKKTLLIAVSRSGGTSETLEAVNAFKREFKSDTVGVTCYPRSELAKIVDYSITVPVGQEKSIAQTRSFSNMMLGISYLITREVDPLLAETVYPAMEDTINHYLPQVQKVGENLDIQRYFFLGNRQLFGLANEAMLKLKEMSLTNSEAYHFLEFRHGPMSMVDENAMVIGLLGSKIEGKELAVLNDMQKLGGHISVVAGFDKPDASSLKTSFWISLAPPHLAPWTDVRYLPLLQLVSLTRSLKKGLNPDKPKNLDAVVVLDQ